MATRTYREQVIVLKKTKLKESDLILTLLASNGRQIRAVAKGARKPTSSFAARLDLFANARVLFATGRSLDIVKEARLVDAHTALRSDVGLMACASPMAELPAKSTQDALPLSRLFDMTQAGFSCLEESAGTARLLLCTAYLWKACALLGFRPLLSGCVECGRSFADASAPQGPEASWLFSPRGGGLVCADCASTALPDARAIEPAIVQWTTLLIGARFKDVVAWEADEDTAFALLRLVRDWIREHVGRLKSLDMLLSLRMY